ncbi:phosphatidate cytidylyltransferase [uncultured Chloroflexus sp.]|uniref:diacylglycerol/polyprenol kinase family protein n=1 Tax=uncultured Chloroflexus sp. TaxID=214040 RepID=UPI0026303F4C|nr:phosphatidate cytidylyltransferase [uncultured Chloroflexus sp.]
MSTRDLIGLLVSFGYAFGLLIIAEVIRRWRGYPQDFTRKFVHIGAGMWVFGVLALFENWTIGIIPFATFIVLNFIFYRFRLLEAVDAPDSTPGTVYFALSITILFLIFWRTNSPDDRGYIAAAGTMAMTWGDALAAIIGKRWGRHHYQVGRGRRSFEGSAAMFAASAIAMFLTLLLVPGSALSPQSAPIGAGVALAASVAAAFVATVAEGVSPHGTDNLSVPLLAGAVIAGVLAGMR